MAEYTIDKIEYDSNVYKLQDNVSGYATLASPAFTGIPTAPTATSGDSSTQIATTAFVQSAMASAGAGTITAVKTTAGTHSTIDVSSGAANFNVPTNTSHLTNDSGFITSPNIPYLTCATAAATAAKTTTLVSGSFTADDLVAGAQVLVKFTYANGKASPTLSVNGTTAKAIMRYGTSAPSTTAASSWNAGSVVLFTYDGTYWQMQGWINSTYSEASVAEITSSSSSTARLISGRRAKAAVEEFAPVKDVTAGGTSVLDGTTAKLVAFTGTDGNDDGVVGLVPAPATTDDGKFLKADGTWATPSGGGTSDYTDLTNKPQINSVTLSGNKSSSDLSLADAVHSHTTSDITDFPSLATVATSGSYADLSNKPSIPTITDTYSGTSSDGMSGKAVKSAIDALDGTVSGTAGSGKTLTAFSQTDGKVSATFGNISITKSQVSDFPIIPSKTSDLINDSGYTTLSLVDVDEQLLDSIVIYATDATTQSELESLYPNKSFSIVVPSDITSLDDLATYLNPRVWFAFRYNASYSLELSRLSASSSLGSTNLNTLFLKGYHSYAAGTMGVSTSWLVVLNPTYIIAEGVSSGGATYRWWNNGKAEAWYHGSSATGLTTAAWVSPVYYKDFTSFSSIWSGVFTMAPTYVTCTSNDSQIFSVYPFSYTQGGITNLRMLTLNAKNNASYDFSVYAVGYWIT